MENMMIILDMGGIYMTNKLNFNRQTQIFDPIKQKSFIHIIGAGCTGSSTARIISKLGFNNIKITDFDKVEEHNLPNQYYRFQDINKFKVDALSEIIKEFSGVNIISENNKIDEKYTFDMGMNNIFVFCVDSMEVRRTMFNLLKDYPLGWIVDTRMDGEDYSIMTCDLSSNEDKEWYATTLEGKSADTSCGAKAVIYTVDHIGIDAAKIIKSIDTDKKVPKCILVDEKNYAHKVFWRQEK